MGSTRRKTRLIFEIPTYCTVENIRTEAKKQDRALINDKNVNGYRAKGYN